MEKPLINLFATKQSYVSHVPDWRTYSVHVDALTTHWGGMWAYAYPPHALLPKILSKYYIHVVLLIASAFLQAQWFQTLLRPMSINRDTSQVTSKQKNTQPLSHVFHPQSEALCLYVLDIISKSKHQQNIYLITVCWRIFRQHQNKISATAYILLLCWRIIDHVKTRHQEQHIAHCFVEEL